MTMSTQEKMENKICIGWDNNNCTNPAGAKKGPYWCEACNKERMDYISKKLDKMLAEFDNKKR